MIAGIFAFFLVLLVGGIFADLGYAATGFEVWGSIFAVAIASALIIIYCKPDDCRKKGSSFDDSDEYPADPNLLQQAIDGLHTLPEEDLRALLALMERLKKRE